MLTSGVRKKDQIHDLIMERLYTGYYRFGQRLLVKELSDETGISRQPIMTALNALNAEGFVIVMAQVGCEVISPTREEIDDFYLMFSRLEALMAELAAVRRNQNQFRRLQMVNVEISSLDPGDSGTPGQYRLLNRSFHELIHSMANSPLLSQRQANIFAMSDFFIAETTGFQTHVAQAAIEHDEVLQAIGQSNKKLAHDTIQAHILAVRDSVLSAL